MAQGKGTALADAEGLSHEGRRALDDALVHLSEDEREAYWASVRKCFNAPYELKSPAAESVGTGVAAAPIEIAPLATISAQAVAAETTGLPAP